MTTAMEALTLVELREAVVAAVEARLGDELTREELTDEVMLELEERYGLSYGEFRAEGFDQLVASMVAQARRAA